MGDPTELDLRGLADELLAHEPVLGRAYASATEVDLATTEGFWAVDADGREVTRALLRAAAPTEALRGEASQVVLQPAGAEAVVLGYLFSEPAGSTRRCTTWVRSPAGWRAAHHQVTRQS